MIDVKKQN